MLAEKLSGSGAAAKTYIEDVFGINLRTGTGAVANVTGMPNLATYGGMVHMKDRGAVGSHYLYDTARGTTYNVYSNLTNAQAANADISSYNTDGFSLTAVGPENVTGENYVDWVWRNAAKFFKVTTVTKTAGSNATVDLSTLGTVGMVKVKRTDAAGSWYVWHRSLTAGKLLIGETTAAEATLGHITVSGTTLTLVNGVIADGTYHVEAYAHDTSADGLIQCGTFTTNASAVATVTLNWETQFLMVKRTDSTGDWIMVDVMRGAGQTGAVYLSPNLSAAESAVGAYRFGTPIATGFAFDGGLAASATYIYMAIRRGPMKPPTSGTQVYNAIAVTGDGTNKTISGVGFPPDLRISMKRSGAATAPPLFMDRLRGPKSPLASSETTAEGTVQSTYNPSGYSNDFTMDGFLLSGQDAFNATANTYIEWLFRRYPGVFDEVCDTGTGVAKTVAHNLTVAPELMIRKARNATTYWQIYHKDLGATKYLELPTTNAAIGPYAGDWNNTDPTASVFTVGTDGAVNSSSGWNYVTYLFATLPGVSKVGSYTGNGTSQTINCGFAAGARFVMIKAATYASDWLVFDTTRGIIAASDPILRLNSTLAETSADWIDPDPSGFSLASANFNESGHTFIYLAFA